MIEGGRSILTEKEKKKDILGYIKKKARKDAVNYREVKQNVEFKTGKKIKLRTVQILGKELKAVSKKTKRKLQLKVNAFIDSY